MNYSMSAINTRILNKVHLLVIVYPTVEFPVLDKAGTGQRHLAHAAVETVLVPAQIHDPHQEPVFYRPAAPGTQLSLATRHAA